MIILEILISQISIVVDILKRAEVMFNCPNKIQSVSLLHQGRKLRPRSWPDN